MGGANASLHFRNPSIYIATAAHCLAMLRSRNAVKAELRKHGVKASHLSARDISVWAQLYLEDHRAELLAQARALIASGALGKRAQKAFIKELKIEQRRATGAWLMDNSNAALIAPSSVNCTVALRKPNVELRTREHLTVGEVVQLIEIAGSNRQGQRMRSWCCLRFGMGCEQLKSVTCAGNKSTSLARPCMSAALSTVRLLRIH